MGIDKVFIHNDFRHIKNDNLKKKLSLRANYHGGAKNYFETSSLPSRENI